MDKNLRHCLPDRIRTILGLMNSHAGCESVGPLIEDGCLCAAQRPCLLWDACQSIHRAFQTEILGRA